MELTSEEKVGIYRARAAEWRKEAERTRDPDRKRTYLMLAESYETLARSEEQAGPTEA